MPISTKCLIAQANACLADNPSELNLTQISGVKSSNTIYSVANIASLPIAECNKGRMIFVEDISAYRYSDGFEWTNCYDTIPRTAYKNIYTWGTAAEGVLGINDTTVNYSSPVQEFFSASDWCFVSASIFYSLAIKDDGTMWGWGCGRGGTLGDGSGGIGARSLTPRQEICSDTTWCFAAVSGDGGSGFAAHSNAIKTNGTLWSFGFGLAGQLGRNNRTTSASPVQEITLSENWCRSASGKAFSAAVKTDGTLWVWGCAGNGRLGSGDCIDTSSPVREASSSSNWVDVKSGQAFSVALKSNGELWGWGCNGCFIGTGDTVLYSSPVQESTSSTNWNKIYANSCVNALGIKTDGTLWIWGGGATGQLGRGNTTGSTVPVQEYTSSTDWAEASINGCPCAATLAIKTNGTLWTWGNNVCGQLLSGDTINRSSPAQEFTSVSDWTIASAGNLFAVGLRSIQKGFNEP